MSRRLVQRPNALPILALGIATATLGCGLFTGIGDYQLVAGLDGGGHAEPTAPAAPSGNETDTSPNLPSTERDAGADDDASHPTLVSDPNSKLVFVTEGEWVGNLGGIAGADNLCTQAASNGGLGHSNTVWKAWLSTTAESAIVRIKSGPFVLPNGQKVADTPAKLTSSMLSSAVNITEKNVPAPTTAEGTRVWTGTNANGTTSATNSSGTCQDWTFSGFGIFNTSVIGSSLSDKAQWTNSSVLGCASTAHLYCFEQ